MYILIAILFSNTGAITSTTTEFSSQQACLTAKATLEQLEPIGNYRKLACVAK